ncbi:methyl-accepting chemotaxis protein [Erwinia pyrifoliae]|uniref:methyl-accepting chemotaxis protein n=1 Tax=Erwinia pyrifoliae TaxID=79967 RepID=UPI00019608AC|nr:methyl-accepting chemotaxis protein [Erwinia pyrifoliae]AUX73976.1 chemotaxis protein [Erwinia pyrifoliae]MCA8875685.1 HAMP domain-containing protein [Erwinia pyrifoliae]MCT2385890.1 methyl-accepting chemotaxis protein [Erwinia pyrifoliae]MCU8588533.1 methyl-accepting chemotaxis protein [Erwinia pyrifoliae]UWS29726.1 methyl-accepting chemotaxis protein [Erwinia pyrifoliae]
MFNHTRITVLLTGAAGFLLALFTAVSFMTSSFLDKSSRAVSGLNNEVSATLSVANTTNFIRRARARMMMALHHMNDADQTMYQAFTQVSRRDVNLAMAFMPEYQSEAKLPGETALAEELQTRFKRYTTSVEALLSALEKKDSVEFLRLAGTDVQRDDEAYDVILAQVIDMHHKSSAAITQAAQSDSRLAYILIILSVMVFLITILLIALLVRRRVIVPLGYAGELTRAIGRGDLTRQVGTQRRDEIGLLMSGLGEMQDQLSKVVNNVILGIDEVSRVSGDIDQGAQSLSARTGQQAAALEQTSASMEELSATVELNAENSANASKFASEAAQTAVRGGELMQQVVSNMANIRSSSTSIGEIIGVINDIAFQTNILALNAAVEAARAGEHGKGFAVVAGEVRTLAQRSASSAKDIANLIQVSEANISEGGALTDRVAKTTADIIESIGSVRDLIGEIAVASREQSQGIGQVGAAVHEMDRVTQQNSSLVSASGESATVLNKQVGNLRAEVAIFVTREIAARGGLKELPVRSGKPTKPACADAQGGWASF